MYAKELVALEPDVLLAQTTGPTAALQQETKTIPIVFVGVSDPIGAAWLVGLSRPAGNITGLLNLDASLGVTLENQNCDRCVVSRQTDACRSARHDHNYPRHDPLNPG
jgi:hypothetical protein